MLQHNTYKIAINSLKDIRIDEERNAKTATNRKTNNKNKSAEIYLNFIYLDSDLLYLI